MLSAVATVGTLSPAASRAIARVRKSIDRGRVIRAGLQPSTRLESDTDPVGNPSANQITPIPL